MPLLIRCEDIQPGMCLSEALQWRGRLLLAAGRTLSRGDIASLRKNYPKLSVRIGDPLLDALVDFEDDSYEREVAQTAQNQVAECMSDVQKRLATHEAIDGPAMKAIYSTISDVIKYLCENPTTIALLDNYMNEDSYLSEHAGNVFYLSMTLGAAARDYVVEERRRQSVSSNPKVLNKASLTQLGLGAMLMDLGMFPLQHLFSSDKPLDAESWKAIREHPLVGAELLPADFPPLAKMMVKMHHENHDGSGYPMGVAGEDLHVFARVVRIADAFDAATAERVYKEARSPIRVLWEMSVGPFQRFYDPRLMSVFSKMIQPFPIGAKVRLTDGRYAVVVRYNRKEPLKPQVIVAFDKHERPLPRAQLYGPHELCPSHSLYVKSFRGDDISFLHDAPVEFTGPSQVGSWPSLYQAAFP